MLKYQIDIHDDIFKKNITPMAPSSSPWVDSLVYTVREP
jgi:hypothetical protein